MFKYLLLGLAMSVLLVGCGKDGARGDTYIKHWWTGTLYFSDDNPGTPARIQKDTNYKTSTGSYSFSYTSWDGSQWSGVYTITANSGEKGGVIQDGAKGATAYFTLSLYSFGPSITNYKQQYKESSLALNKGVSGRDKLNDLAGEQAVLPQTGKHFGSYEEIQGGYKMTVTYWKVLAGV